MSRVGTPFSDAGEDAFLPSIEQGDGGFETYQGHFGEGDAPAFSSAYGGDVLGKLDLGLGEGSPCPVSGTSTPDHDGGFDFNGYEYEVARERTSVYPGPDELTEAVHPYHTHQHAQQEHLSHASTRPLPHRSTTNGHVGYAPGPLQVFHQAHHPPHRRSYSQNDTERITNLHPLGVYNPSQPGTNSNPTFVRLCETRHSRASKTSPGSKQRHHPQTRPAARSRAHPPTSTPVAIGRPLPQDHRDLRTAGSVQLTGPRMVHMTHAEQRRTSQKIIEVGAIAVLNRSAGRSPVDAIDPALLEADFRKRDKSGAPSPEAVGGGEPREKMYRDLEAMEVVMRDGGGEMSEGGKKGCEVIREVRMEMDDKGGGEGGREDSLDESGMFSAAGTNAHGAESSEGESALSEGDDEFMRMLLEGSPSSLA